MSKPRLQTLKPRLQTLQSPVKMVEAPSWRMDKQSASERGYDHKWQKARDRYLAEHPLCAYCHEAGRLTPATVVDHKIPHRGDMGLFWDKANWQSLCKPCHDGRKQREEAAQP